MALAVRKNEVSQSFSFPSHGIERGKLRDGRHYSRPVPGESFVGSQEEIRAWQERIKNGTKIHGDARTQQKALQEAFAPTKTRPSVPDVSPAAQSEQVNEINGLREDVKALKDLIRSQSAKGLKSFDSKDIINIRNGVIAAAIATPGFFLSQQWATAKTTLGAMLPSANAQEISETIPENYAMAPGADILDQALLDSLAASANNPEALKETLDTLTNEQVSGLQMALSAMSEERWAANYNHQQPFSYTYEPQNGEGAIGNLIASLSKTVGPKAVSDNNDPLGELIAKENAAFQREKPDWSGGVQFTLGTDGSRKIGVSNINPPGL